MRTDRIPAHRTALALVSLAVGGAAAWLGSAPASAQAPAAAKAPATAETVADPALRRELLARMEKDQQAREQLIQWMQQQNRNPAGKSADDDPRLVELRKVDTENRTWLKQLIEKSGWPVASRVGTDGGHAAWLLVQHADDEPEFQKQCLELMRKAAPGEVSLTDVAYLTDRVMVKETGKQLYGTQVRLERGQWEVMPLAEPERVDALRKEAGMMPLAEYLAFVAKVYSGSAKEEQPAAKSSAPK